MVYGGANLNFRRLDRIQRRETKNEVKHSSRVFAIEISLYVRVPDEQVVVDRQRAYIGHWILLDLLQIGQQPLDSEDAVLLRG